MSLMTYMDIDLHLLMKCFVVDFVMYVYDIHICVSIVTNRKF